MQQTSGLDWQGSILAPNAAVSVGNGNLYGQIARATAVTIGSDGLVHRPLRRLPAARAAKDLSLASLCTDP